MLIWTLLTKASLYYRHLDLEQLLSQIQRRWLYEYRLCTLASVCASVRRAHRVQYTVQQTDQRECMGLLEHHAMPSLHDVSNDGVLVSLTSPMMRRLVSDVPTSHSGEQASRQMLLASVFWHPASQSGTVAFWYWTGEPLFQYLMEFPVAVVQ